MKEKYKNEININNQKIDNIVQNEKSNQRNKKMNFSRLSINYNEKEVTEIKTPSLDLNALRNKINEHTNNNNNKVKLFIANKLIDKFDEHQSLKKKFEGRAKFMKKILTNQIS